MQLSDVIKGRRSIRKYTLPELSNSLNPPAEPGIYRIKL